MNFDLSGSESSSDDDDFVVQPALPSPTSPVKPAAPVALSDSDSDSEVSDFVVNDAAPAPQDSPKFGRRAVGTDPGSPDKPLAVDLSASLSASAGFGGGQLASPPSFFDDGDDDDDVVQTSDNDDEANYSDSFEESGSEAAMSPRGPVGVSRAQAPREFMIRSGIPVMHAIAPTHPLHDSVYRPALEMQPAELQQKTEALVEEIDFSAGDDEEEQRALEEKLRVLDLAQTEQDRQAGRRSVRFNHEEDVQLITPRPDKFGDPDGGWRARHGFTGDDDDEGGYDDGAGEEEEEAAAGTAEVLDEDLEVAAINLNVGNAPPPALSAPEMLDSPPRGAAAASGGSPPSQHEPWELVGGGRGGRQDLSQEGPDVSVTQSFTVDQMRALRETALSPSARDHGDAPATAGQPAPMVAAVELQIKVTVEACQSDDLSALGVDMADAEEFEMPGSAPAAAAAAAAGPGQVEAATNGPSDGGAGGEPPLAHRTGWLAKHWKGTHTHHQQYFVLHDLSLAYYDLDQDASVAKPKGSILWNDVRRIAAGDVATKIEIEIECTHDGKPPATTTLVLEADDAADAFGWMQALDAASTHERPAIAAPGPEAAAEHEQLQGGEHTGEEAAADESMTMDSMLREAEQLMMSSNSSSSPIVGAATSPAVAATAPDEDTSVAAGAPGGGGGSSPKGGVAAAVAAREAAAAESQLQAELVAAKVAKSGLVATLGQKETALKRAEASLLEIKAELAQAKEAGRAQGREASRMESELAQLPGLRAEVAAAKAATAKAQSAAEAAAAQASEASKESARLKQELGRASQQVDDLQMVKRVMTAAAKESEDKLAALQLQVAEANAKPAAAAAAAAAAAGGEAGSSDGGDDKSALAAEEATRAAEQARVDAENQLAAALERIESHEQTQIDYLTRAEEAEAKAEAAEAKVAAAEVKAAALAAQLAEEAAAAAAAAPKAAEGAAA
eukprot:SAG22_NODE_416_length_10804_cov_4.791126_1_plen_958_part_10